MQYRVTYSWTNNCLRATPRRGNIEFLPFTTGGDPVGGRRLKPREMEIVARKHWGERGNVIVEFTYLSEAQEKAQATQ